MASGFVLDAVPGIFSFNHPVLPPVKSTFHPTPEKLGKIRGKLLRALATQNHFRKPPLVKARFAHYAILQDGHNSWFGKVNVVLPSHNA